MTPTGTPDWQRSTVDAGALISGPNVSTASVTVTVPVNAQTIAVVMGGPLNPTEVTCQGTTTNFLYPGQSRPGGPTSPGDSVWYFSVASQLDAQVTITLTGSIGVQPWFVVATTGVQVVDVPEVAAIVAFNGSAALGEGVQVMGYDGTDSRTLLTDATGKLVISNPGGGLSVTIGGVIGSLMVPVGGSDGTDARVFETDTNGRQIPLVPTGSSGKVAVPATGTTILAAPGSGHNYLYGCDLANTSGGSIQVTISSGATVIAFIVVPPANSFAVEFAGFATAAAITGTANSSPGITATLRYAPGP